MPKKKKVTTKKTPKAVKAPKEIKEEKKVEEPEVQDLDEIAEPVEEEAIPAPVEPEVPAEKVMPAAEMPEEKPVIKPVEKKPIPEDKPTPNPNKEAFLQAYAEFNRNWKVRTPQKMMDGLISSNEKAVKSLQNVKEGLISFDDGMLIKGIELVLLLVIANALTLDHPLIRPFYIACAIILILRVLILAVYMIRPDWFKRARKKLLQKYTPAAAEVMRQIPLRMQTQQVMDDIKNIYCRTDYSGTVAYLLDPNNSIVHSGEKMNQLRYWVRKSKEK